MRIAIASLLALSMAGCQRRDSTAPVEGKAPSLASARPSLARVPEQVCVGLLHSCARAQEEVACWGDNTWHQTAASDEPQIEKPRIAQRLPAAVDLHCGAFETCVRTAKGTVHCQGGGAEAEDVTLPRPAVDLVLHRHGGCALVDDGRVLCWSWPGGSSSRREAREVASLAGATTFASSVSFADGVCALRASGAPVCIRGLLPNETPVAVEGDAQLAGARFLIRPSAAGGPLCAVLQDHRVMCADSSLGAPGPVGPAIPAGLTAAEIVAPWDGGFCLREPGRALRCVGERTPLIEAAPPSSSALAFGNEHACAIDGGDVRCWGASSHGQLGDGASYLHVRPARVPGVSDALAIDTSDRQGCAIARRGIVTCWGQRPEQGAKLATDFTPQSLPPTGAVIEVRAAGTGAPGTPAEGRMEPVCVRRASGWRCWEGRWTPRDATKSPLLRLGAAPRALSRDLQCGISKESRLVCAGAPSYAGTRTTPTKLLAFAPSERFAEATSLFYDAHHAYVCARTESKKIRCFPVEENAIEKPVSSSSIDALPPVLQVSAAGHGEDSVACALVENGEVFCWGDGRFGQLGGATPRDRFEAVRIQGLPPLAQIAAGGTFVCGRTGDGQVFCWGSNRNGAASDGEPGSRSEPVSVTWPSR